jgi:isoprenylcysteine carboxyl methyltransferase (ICMT) family protein YpbQ
VTWRHLIDSPWIVFVVYWALSALKTRRTQRKESFASRYGILLLEVAGFAHLGRNCSGTMGALDLGQYWSARITIKEDHKPIRTGPYARLRHPISTTYACELIWTNHGLWMLASGNRFWNH